MSAKQLAWILELWQSGALFQSLEFPEDGTVIAKFFDSGGNWHHQELQVDGSFVTLD